MQQIVSDQYVQLYYYGMTQLQGTYFESLITNFNRVQTANKTCENTLI